jgi:hypothetical protein
MVLMDDLMEVDLLVDGVGESRYCVDKGERRKKWEGRLFVVEARLLVVHSLGLSALS